MKISIEEIFGRETAEKVANAPRKKKKKLKKELAQLVEKALQTWAERHINNK